MNHPELLQKLTSVQTALWPAVTNQMAEACGVAVQINSPLVLEAQVDEMLQEFAAPALMVQFAFAGQRDTMQIVLVPLDTATALGAALGVEIAELTDEVVEGLRLPLEAMVQGICLGLGNARNEIVVASELSFRIARLARPASMQPTDSLFRVQLACSVDATIGSLTWLMDAATAHFVGGLQPPSAAQTSNPFTSLPPFGGSHGQEESHGLDILMDIPLDISVELGRTKLVVREVVDLGVGSIVEIDKAAGEPVDILVNGRLVAHGEVVVIEDNFGVRITEILNPRERISRLAEAA